MQNNKYVAPVSPKKKPETNETDQSILTDSTSVTMMNSFLIKNAGPSFDNFHKAYMANRKSERKATVIGASLTNQAQAAFTYSS